MSSLTCVMGCSVPRAGRLRRLYLRAGDVEHLAHLGTLLFGERAQTFHERGQLAALSEEAHSDFSELLHAVRRVYRGECSLFDTFDLCFHLNSVHMRARRAHEI